MSTAFIASTLPSLFLKKNLKRLKVSKIVVSREDLLNSFSFLLQEYPALEIVKVPEKNKRQFLKEEIQCSSDAVIIFHECGWFELDLLLLELKPKVQFYPQATLDSFKKLDTEDLTLINLLSNLFTNLSYGSFKLLFRVLKYKDIFTYYSVPQDNTRKLGFEYSLNHNKYLDISNRLEQSQASEEIEDKRNGNENSKNIIIFTGTDIFPTSEITDIFLNIFELLKKKGYQIFIKDHPNPSFRLNLICEYAIQLEAAPAFEILEVDYFLKIGIATTALAYQPAKSISIIYLLGKDSETDDRIKHLKSLPGGNTIKYPKSLYDLEKLF